MDANLPQIKDPLTIWFMSTVLKVPLGGLQLFQEGVHLSIKVHFINWTSAQKALRPADGPVL